MENMCLLFYFILPSISFFGKKINIITTCYSQFQQSIYVFTQIKRNNPSQILNLILISVCTQDCILARQGLLLFILCFKCMLGRATYIHQNKTTQSSQTFLSSYVFLINLRLFMTPISYTYCNVPVLIKINLHKNIFQPIYSFYYSYCALL